MMTMGQFATFAIMAFCLCHMLKGWLLLRTLGFVFAWQWLTPIRPMAIDLPLMVIASFLAELAYGLLKHRSSES